MSLALSTSREVDRIDHLRLFSTALKVHVEGIIIIIIIIIIVVIIILLPSKY